MKYTGVFSYLLLLTIASVHAWNVIGDRKVSHVSLCCYIYHQTCSFNRNVEFLTVQTPNSNILLIAAVCVCVCVVQCLCSVCVSSGVFVGTSFSVICVLVLRSPESLEP